MQFDAVNFLYLGFLALVFFWYVIRHLRRERISMEIQKESLEAGLTEPASLHPLIDATKCIGSGACVAACPEQPAHHVLGLINRRAQLISPTDCIGHGACQKACPMDAISLVFGTEKRGVDIPVVNPDFQTNVPGMYIAGELGGMGLIKNAIEQGKQAMNSIIKSLGSKRNPQPLDVLIIGAGPSGFAATLLAHEKKLRYITVEQESLGGTVFQFPRGKLVMTAPAELPIVGKMKFVEAKKEAVLEFWQQAEKKSKVKINYYEKVESINKKNDIFEVKTSKGLYQSHTVLLAIGRRGSPRKLGVPGEDLPKVVYRLIDPEQYRANKVLIAGGGDSALEAAYSIAEQPGSKVTLSYRGDAFNRAKQKNRLKVEQMAREGKLTIVLNSNVASIDEKSVTLRMGDEEKRLENDAVIINAGGILPTGFLKEIGIEVETKYGTS